MSALPSAAIALLAAGGASLLVRPSLAFRTAGRRPRERAPDAGWMVRWRWVVSPLAGAAALLVANGALGVVLALVAGVGCWIGIARLEPPGTRREREQAARDLPHLVQLLAAALAAGAAPVSAIEAVAEAAPGPVAGRLAAAASRLRLGADPAEVWSDLARAPSLGPLGRTLGRAHDSGASVSVAMSRLAEELARVARSDVESRARSVGVKAAVPLGLCLLPCFLLIGVVPLAAGLLTSLRW